MARRRGAGTILQMIERRQTGITATTGAGRRDTIKGPREGMTGTGTGKGKMITGKDIGLPQEAGVDRLHGPAKVPIPLFVAGEVTMTETSTRINDQRTRSRGSELRKQEEALNILQDKLRYIQCTYLQASLIPIIDELDRELASNTH